MKWHCTYLWVYPLANIRRYHLSQIPELARLILRVADDIPTITLRIDVRETLSMTQEHTRRPLRSQTAAIPDFKRRVVRARVQNVRTHLITEADGVHIVRMATNLHHAALGFEVVDVHTVFAGAGYNLATVTTEA
jgi:hypothetical protein